jgi:hypothetical protein
MASIVFLDDFLWRFDHEGIQIPVVPFTFYEHCLQVDGDYMNQHFFTCLGRNCPLCQAKIAKKQVFAFTVLNLWKKEGDDKEHATKQLFICTSQTAMLLEGKMQKKGNLRGLKYSVSRTGDKAAKVGNDFEYEENVGEQLKALYPEVDTSPYNSTAEEAMEYYKNLFMPKPEADIRAFMEKYSYDDGYVFNKNNATPIHKPSGGGTDTKGADGIEY